MADYLERGGMLTPAMRCFLVDLLRRPANPNRKVKEFSTFDVWAFIEGGRGDLGTTTKAVEQAAKKFKKESNAVWKIWDRAGGQNAGEDLKKLGGKVYRAITGEELRFTDKS